MPPLQSQITVVDEPIVHFDWARNDKLSRVDSIEQRRASRTE